MANDGDDIDLDGGDDDLEIVRFNQGPKVFGLGMSTIVEKIKTGELPAPFPLSEGGKALGWTRGTIRAHHAAMAKLAERRRTDTPKLKIEKPAALVENPRPKKRKLRPPGASS